MRRIPKPVRIKEQFVKKNFITLFCAFVLPQLFLGLLLAWNAFQTTSREVHQRMENTLKLTAEDMDRLYNHGKTVELYFKNGGVLLGMDRMMLEGTASYTDYMILKQFTTMIQSMINSSTDLKSIYLYFPNNLNRVYTSDQKFIDVKWLKDKEWIEVLRNGKEESFLWTRRKKDYDFEEDKKLLSVFHKLRNYPGGIVFNYDMEKLLKSYESALFYPEQFLIVTDQAGGYVLKNEKCPSELAVMFSGALDEGKDTINLQGEKYRFIEQEYDSLHLRLITAVPEQLFYQASLEHMQTTIFSLSLILLFSIFLAWIISVNDYSHLSQIIQWFELAAAKKPLPESKTKDMYSQILQNIIQMFLKNDYLEIRLSEEKFKKQVAELQALQYQINPHFLFNTLQTIRYEILDETGKEDGCAERMVGNLADIMRYSLDSGEKKVALREEADNCKKYIEIQQIRYQNRFQTEWDIENGLQEQEILRLILQPLVENSIIHGIQRKQDGKIRIKIRRKEKGVLITVLDNGCGMDANQLQKLRMQLGARTVEYENQHIGLQNVNLRLLLEYGCQSCLRIRSHKGMGTEVVFYIPGKE